MTVQAYVPKKRLSVAHPEIRQLRYKLNCWGDPAAPVLMLLHGWADCGATFQFLVDALPEDWYVVAPDWRGFGGTEWASDGYWFPDYLGDLELIMQHVAGDKPVAVVGHSMGGHIASLYAGMRPARIRRFVNIEGFGPPRPVDDDALSRYGRWLDGLTGNFQYRSFSSLAALAQHLQARHRWLSAERALFIASCWASESENGTTLYADPLHKRVTPYLYSVEDLHLCWSNTQAPVMFMLGDDSRLYQRPDRVELLEQRHAHYVQMDECVIADAGHMVHHDQPERAAQEIVNFLRR